MDKERAIRGIVEASVRVFAQTFADRHIAAVEDPDGVINMKIHNLFIAELGEEVVYYSALSRSLDSSLGNMLETMAMAIAKLSYTVRKEVEGPLYRNQTVAIAELLEAYKRHVQLPQVADYQSLAASVQGEQAVKRHDSDYCLFDAESGDYHLIELKIGGDLDNKKARSEKEALLEQYCILANSLGSAERIRLHFATAYNRYGEGRPWTQSRVLQFFAQDELLISKDFWNMVCKQSNGYEVVLSEYRKQAPLIVEALRKIRECYLA